MHYSRITALIRLYLELLYDLLNHIGAQLPNLHISCELMRVYQTGGGENMPPVFI
jgi:hypothetical protein